MGVALVAFAAYLDYLGTYLTSMRCTRRAAAYLCCITCHCPDAGTPRPTHTPNKPEGCIGGVSKWLAQ